MRISTCRECSYYMIDDGREILCCFPDSVSYLEIRTDSAGHEVCRCPRESEFERKSGFADYRIFL